MARAQPMRSRYMGLGHSMSLARPGLFWCWATDIRDGLHIHSITTMGLINRLISWAATLGGGHWQVLLQAMLGGHIPWEGARSVVQKQKGTWVLGKRRKDSQPCFWVISSQESSILHLPHQGLSAEVEAGQPLSSTRNTSSPELRGKTWPFWLSPSNPELVGGTAWSAGRCQELSVRVAPTPLPHLGELACSLSHSTPPDSRGHQEKQEGCCHNVKMDNWPVQILEKPPRWEWLQHGS